MYKCPDLLLEMPGRVIRAWASLSIPDAPR
jgi:hypothetical protein